MSSNTEQYQWGNLPIWRCPITHNKDQIANAIEESHFLPLPVSIQDLQESTCKKVDTCIRKKGHIALEIKGKEWHEFHEKLKNSIRTYEEARSASKYEEALSVAIKVLSCYVDKLNEQHKKLSHTQEDIYRFDRTLSIVYIKTPIWEKEFEDDIIQKWTHRVLTRMDKFHT